ncbi:MAG: serine acetyltransferase [Tannerella sp.]|jgi:serine O-acetyltransferase|nr:serine acetyltransferase [Tannerella sp.]
MKLKEYINADRMDYWPPFSKGAFMDWLLRPDQSWVRSFVKYLRKEEYYTFYRKNKLLQYYYQRKKNMLACRLGFHIEAGCIGPGLRIYHYGPIHISPKSRIGKNCTLHRSCVIGTKGTYPIEYPMIGDNVDIGVDAKILGGITIADGVKIGAGAVVTKSITEPGVTVAGIPARIIKR